MGGHQCDFRVVAHSIFFYSFSKFCSDIVKGWGCNPIKRGEIENSIIMDHCLIDVDEKITDSLIGPYSTMTSRPGENARPKGRRFIVGEGSHATM